MMRDVYIIIAVGMTRFGKHLDRTEKDLVAEAFAGTMADAPDIKISDIQSALVCQYNLGILQHAACHQGPGGAAASGHRGHPYHQCGECLRLTRSTALHGAYKDVAGGMYECSLAIGMEKLYNEDKAKSMMAFNAGVDVANIERTVGGFARHHGRGEAGHPGR
ncbi:MAG: hypothetical protein MZV70_15545 [Desulfobacterales bacterium]|nr:hypothetical protein [Desulfobacterales bacterium]